MNNKQIVLVIMVVAILVISGLIIAKRKMGEDSPLDIIFGDECNFDEDCMDSFRTCRDGIEASCKNGCVYGRCTRCVPVCPGESACSNITCIDSIRICPDGKKARCANYCDPYTQKCTLCVPECNITVTDSINYQLKEGIFILDAVPCINFNHTEKKEVRIINKKVPEIKLPEGYSIIIEPFTVNEDGPLDVTLNIPETYTDIKALKCRGEDCNPVSIKYVTELRCSEKISKEYLRETDYLEPKLMPVKIKERSLNITAGEEIISDKYKVKLGSNSGDLNVTLAMPKKPVEEAKNPSLKITGTPLIIKINNEVKDNVNATVAMPYGILNGFEKDSVAMYAKEGDGWKYVGGEIDEDEKTITAFIHDVSSYLNEDNELEVALMGILCISCYGSSLTKVYRPEKGSNDAIVLIHGFASGPDTYKEMVNDIKLTNQPFEVWTFNYPSSNSINESKSELMSLLEKNHANYKNIYLVAHSLGGLIAQQALYDSYMENKERLEKKEPVEYNYLEKIRKVILAGASNEGSPVIEVYRNLFESLINIKEQSLFNLNSEVIKSIAKGIITPRVPGIEYRAIAGAKPYSFNLLFFKLPSEDSKEVYEKNDGIITVKSAQHIGDRYISNQCKDYWEVNLTHTQLIDDPLARKIIEKIISEDVPEKDIAILGRNKFFDLSVDGLAGDTYMIIGKKIREEEVLDETGCSCGNGFCGEGENEVSCPSDCARFLSEKNKNSLFIVLAALLAISLAAFWYKSNKQFSYPNLKTVVEYIKTNYEIVPYEGYTCKQLRDAFLAKGWPKRIVNDAINLLRKEFHRKYSLNLKKQFKEQLKKGYAKEKIKKVLVNAGWNEVSVDKFLKGEELEPGFKLKKGIKPGFKPDFKEGKGKYFGLKKQ